MNVLRRPIVVLVLLLVAVAGGGLFAAKEVSGLDELGTPVRAVTTTGPGPGPLQGTNGFAVKADGRLTDLALVPGLGEVISVEEVTHRVWRATAVDARTGAVRWSNQRGHTGHIEAWAVTDAAVVLAYHNSASRLAWRTHHAADFEGLDPVTGRLLWTRHIYNLINERPGDYAPNLASPHDNLVYARTEFGVPTAIDTRTGETVWEHPGLNDCANAHDIVAGPAGVAMVSQCPKGRQRVELLDPHTGKAVWKTDISTPALRLVAVGTDTVAVYQGGLVHQLIVLGPGGGYVSQIPCDCGDGAGLSGGVVAGTVFSGPTIGLVGVGGTVLLGGPMGLVGVDAATGAIRWRTPVEGGPVHRVLAQDGDAYVISGTGGLIHVDAAGGALQTVVPGAPGTPLDPNAVIAATGGYIAAGSAAGFGFSGPPPS
ncbi:MAG TPA: PQQ-binding-like beta-propeller repeat protein [Acidimicrobiia bacterium]|nr:PQQ-binding-like beta-propeller repeat protein [Acidimicrobiia bacterium]